MNILIIEDHPMVSEGLTHVLKVAEPDITCFSASTCQKGLAMLNGRHIDLVFLDINLPDGNGIDLCATIKSRYPDMKVIGITSFEQRTYIEKMLANGASGYVQKNACADEILKSIREVMEGKQFLSERAREILKGKPSNDGSTPCLTPREKEVLHHIAHGSTNVEIAEKLFISPETVITHRKNLLIKFGAKNTAELIKIAVMNGFIE